MGCFLSKKTLIDVSNQLKENGRNVVLTHGAFDLFHIGHATLLKESRRKGDYLIVGLESDERVAKYKKYGRPIIPLEQRIEILLENKSVDFIYAIDDLCGVEGSYYLKMCEELNPKIVTCGRHFAFQRQFKERQKILKGVSFTKISHQFDDVQSTTEIIDRIRNYP